MHKDDANELIDIVADQAVVLLSRLLESETLVLLEDPLLQVVLTARVERGKVLRYTVAADGKFPVDYRRLEDAKFSYKEIVSEA